MSVETQLGQGAQDSPMDQSIDEVATPANEGWLRGEVSLREMLEEPIVRMVLARDGWDKDQVQAALLAAALRSKRRQESNAGPQR